MEEAEIITDVEAAQPSVTTFDAEAGSLSASMQQKINTLWGKPDEIQTFTIFRVPRNIRKSKKDIFEPCVVSIGPFYHGKESLRTMEEKKWRLLRDFLSRGDHISLDLCISEMKALEEKTRRCYSETVESLDSDGFVRMMLLDGCFVLQYFLKCYEGKPSSIFEVGWNFAFTLSDMLLLENQIPFFVVEKLCEIGVKQEHRLKFINYILSNMARELTSSSHIPNPPSVIHHLVHFCYHCSVPNPDKPVVSAVKFPDLSILWRWNKIRDFLFRSLFWVLTRRFPDSTREPPAIPKPNGIERSVMVIPCATTLQDSGVKFRAKSTSRHMFDISFKNGVMEIPRLTINDNTRSLVMNLVAYEQCKFAEMKSHLTSFVSFMDSLVNTTKDVVLLQQCGVIENCLSSEEELTLFFNQLSQGLILMDNHFLAELFKEVNRYCESGWNRHRAKLIRDYFSSPWAVISLTAAFVLLVLTCIQSFFAVYTYFRPLS